MRRHTTTSHLESNCALVENDLISIGQYGVNNAQIEFEVDQLHSPMKQAYVYPTG